MKQIEKNKTFNENLALAAVNKGAALLRLHEEGMRDTSDSMFAFAMHLYQIKSKELWRHAECSSYKNYCEVRVPTLFKVIYGKSQLYRLPEWVEANEDVSPIGETEPTIPESQARELIKAPKKKRAKILAESSKDGKPTAKKIAEVRDKNPYSGNPVNAEFKEVVKDSNGDEVPENIIAEFQRAERESKEHINAAQSIKNFLERDDSVNIEARGLRETAKDLLAGMKVHLTKHVLCPKCKGKKCAVCSKRGFTSKNFATKGIGKKED